MTGITDQAISIMEAFRANMRNIGQATPRIETFVDEMNALIVLCDSPKDALDVLFRALAAKEAQQAEATAC